MRRIWTAGSRSEGEWYLEAADVTDPSLFVRYPYHLGHWTPADAQGHREGWSRGLNKADLADLANRLTQEQVRYGDSDEVAK